MALRDIFPGTQLKGCGFHWAQAILRKVQDVGLKATYERRDGAHMLIRKLVEKKLNNNKSEYLSRM